MEQHQDECPRPGSWWRITRRRSGRRHAWRAWQTALTVGHGKRPALLSAQKVSPRVGGSSAFLTTPTPAKDSIALA